jgi:hypothetical protein
MFMMNVNRRYFEINGTTMLVGGIILAISKKNTTWEMKMTIIHMIQKNSIIDDIYTYCEEYT